MPDYSLKCKVCEKQFSFFGSWEKRKVLVCPECGSSELEQDYSTEGTVGIRQIRKDTGCTGERGAGCAGCRFR